MLTQKQSELLAFLTSHMDAHEVPPSFDEMRDALGLASKSGIHRLVSGQTPDGGCRILMPAPMHRASRQRMVAPHAHPYVMLKMPAVRFVFA